MRERIKKINNICGVSLFVLLIIITIGTLISAITIPWLGKLMDDQGYFNYYYITTYITNMSWTLFVFGILGIGISILNFFTKNKFKYIETIFLSAFLIFTFVITILLKPYTYLDITTVKAQVISAFATFMFEFFIIMLYFISRTLQFWLFKPEENASQVAFRNKKHKLIAGILSITMSAISLISCMTLFILPYSLAGSQIATNEADDGHLYIKNNSDKEIVNVYIMVEYYSGSEIKYSHEYYSHLAPNKMTDHIYQSYTSSLKSLHVFYEVEGLEGATPAALSLLPIALASSMFTVQWALQFKKKKDEASDEGDENKQKEV